MLELLANFMIMLRQNAREKKLTFLYIGLFLLFLMMLILDARTKKHQFTGPKAVYNIIVFFLFLASVGLIIAYIRL